MITGLFRDDHPRIRLVLPGLHGDVEIEFIVDTGFAGDFALPAPIVYRLDGIFKGSKPHLLADGRLASFPVFKTTVDRDGEPREVEILIMDCQPLVGTIFLRGYMLQIEIEKDGDVSAEEM